jgi:iron complex transport system substrate-binding protein
MPPEKTSAPQSAHRPAATAGAAGFLPRRIVSLQPSATVILHAVGELDRLVACTRYCLEACPQASVLHPLLVSDSWTAQSAQILAAHPDLVIASVPYQEKALAEILKSGARFLGLAPRTLDDIYGDILAIARLVDAAARGLRVVAEMQDRLRAARRASLGAQSRPRVFCEEWGKPVICSQPWVRELVEAAGGEFVGEPGKSTTSEDIRAADPEVFIAAWCGAGDRVPLEKIVRDRHWEQLSAVRSGRVFCISDELLNTPAPTLLGGLVAIAWALHPADSPPPLGLRRLRHPSRLET